MAHTHTNLTYHVIFSTKDRRPLIRDAFRDGSGYAPEVIVVGTDSASSTTRPSGPNLFNPYGIGVTEVTLGEYRAFIKDTEPTFEMRTA